MSFSSDALTDLALSRVSLDRSGLERREEHLIERLVGDPRTRVLELRGDRAPVVAGPRLWLRAPEDADGARLTVFLGRDVSRTPYLGVVGPGIPDESSHTVATMDGVTVEWQSLRRAGGELGDLDAGLFTTMLALSNWHATHTHCPRCGTPTEQAQGGWLRVCPADGSEHYPRTDPAVIMSVLDQDDRLLLGRGPGWPEGRFSVLAGFVEPGESFEAAVAREVEEEVGIVVTDVRYLGDQPWPFPSSVMIGYTSRATTASIDLDPHELAEARWVSRDEYRAALRSGELKPPSGISIAKRLIEHWLGSSVEAVLDGRAEDGRSGQGAPTR